MCNCLQDVLAHVPNAGIDIARYAALHLRTEKWHCGRLNRSVANWEEGGACVQCIRTLWSALVDTMQVAMQKNNLKVCWSRHTPTPVRHNAHGPLRLLVN